MTTSTSSAVESDNAALRIDEDIARLRESFFKARYGEREIAQLLGGKLATAPTAAEIPVFLQRTSGGTPRETLVRLFLLGVSTDVDAARQALAPADLDRWASAGLVEVSDVSVVPKVKILPFKGLLLACDIPGSGRSDFVMGLGASSLSLLQIALGGARRSTLDLGTGCGVQALLAAPHSERVVATDKNPRALDFARFNAALNGIGNVEFLEGDRFEPVQGEEFDLILCNPPAVISPDSTFLWRDSGPEGDGFSRQIVQQASASLRDGGFCQLVCHMAHRSEGKWQTSVADWFQGTGCDGWIIRKATRGRMEYALSCPAEESGADSLANRASRWMAYYDREGIVAVSTVLITMRKRGGGSNWLRVDTDAQLEGRCGLAIEQGFAAHDFLVGAQDDWALMDARPRLSPDVELVQRARPGAGAWQMAEARLRHTHGISYSDAVDPTVANLIVRCDGERKIGDLIGELAASRNTELGKVAPPLLEVVRRLVARGVLVP